MQFLSFQCYDLCPKEDLNMAHLQKDIVDDALALSTNERVALVERLLESLDAPNDEVNEIWSKEADQRVQAYESKQIGSKPVSEVLQKYK
jgi:putative addiction module component (TIGR02574 family)